MSMDLAAHRKMQKKINELDAICADLREVLNRLDAKVCKCGEKKVKAAVNG